MKRRHSELSQGSSSEHPLPHGPVDYPDIFAWPARVLERAKDVYGKALTRRNLATAKKGFCSQALSVVWAPRRWPWPCWPKNISQVVSRALPFIHIVKEILNAWLC